MNTSTKSKKLKSSKTKPIVSLKRAKDAEELKKHYFNTGKAEGSGYYSRETYAFMVDIEEGELDDYKNLEQSSDIWD